MKISEKVSQLLLILTMAAVLLTLMVVTVIREKTTFSYYENRNLAQKPEFGMEAVVDGSYFTGWETYLQEHSAGRNTLLRVNTWLEMNAFDRPVVSDVVITEEVLLPYMELYHPGNTYIHQMAQRVADNLAGYRDRVEAYGGKFYYVAVPCQYVLFEDRYPDYLDNREEYTDECARALFSNLDQRGVAYIDVLEIFREKGLELEVASAVDNHFSIFGAFETYSALMERIASDGGRQPLRLNMEDFTPEQVQRHYLGSRNRKLFDMWPSDEPVYMLRPREEIPFTRYDRDNAQPSASSVYSIPSDPNAPVLYSLYMGGDIPHTRLETNREELPSILVYGDSFTNPVECILWTGFDTMDSLDFRHYKDMTLHEFIDLHQPDYVVCIRDYEQLISPWGNGQ